MELKKIREKIEILKNDILDYILKTEHYIFNWISSKEIQEFIKKYPDNYENMIHLNVIDVNITPRIRICFEDHPNKVKYIEKYTNLPAFKDSAKTKWLEWNDKGMIKENQILAKELEVKCIREQLDTAEKELEELKNNK